MWKINCKKQNQLIKNSSNNDDATVETKKNIYEGDIVKAYA